jgi:anion-transporting  ArsA/GET3 family ATPase
VDPGEFCTQARVIIVAGKGGVGKTTVSATLARMAARAGLDVLVVEVEGDSSLPALFGRSVALSYHPVVLAERGPGEGRVVARTLTPDDALMEYLADHGLGRVSRRLTSGGTLDVIATAVPGMKDILVLGKVKQLERAAAAGGQEQPDLIVVDAPAAGHAITFLASAHGLVDAVNVGPIRSQAADVVELLADPRRCQVLLVTLPEETPVNEAVETAYHLEDRAGVKLAPVVVNGIYPRRELPADATDAARRAGAQLDPGQIRALDDAAAFRRRRQALQAAQVERLAHDLPLPQVHLPYLFETELGPRQVDQLAAAMAAQVGLLTPVGRR